ncbi:MAG: 50S ribosomal protein L24 [Gammaproteobacteria bacterium]|nr:50S ribosomal protein L24 [Gammaproteobacteria bacterium]
MKKIKKGDEVVVITGKDKGKRGIVLSVLLKGKKLLVEGINTAKKHVKANPNADERGGIVLKTLPIQGSNVMLYNPATQKGSRVGIRVLEDGRKVRYFKSTDEVVDVGV